MFNKALKLLLLTLFIANLSCQDDITESGRSLNVDNLTTIYMPPVHGPLMTPEEYEKKMYTT